VSIYRDVFVFLSFVVICYELSVICFYITICYERCMLTLTTQNTQQMIDSLTNYSQWSVTITNDSHT